MLDDLVVAPEEVETSLLIHPAAITGEQSEAVAAGSESSTGTVRHLPVAVHHGRAGHRDLPVLARRNRNSLSVNALDVGAGQSSSHAVRMRLVLLHRKDGDALALRHAIHRRIAGAGEACEQLVRGLGCQTRPGIREQSDDGRQLITTLQGDEH